MQSGRFCAYRAGIQEPIAEIGVGEPIGEVGFFGNTSRSATVVAVRDSIVLKLDRRSFDQIAERAPSIYRLIAAVMARRLWDTTAKLPNTRLRTPIRTVAIIGAGDRDIPPDFLARLRDVLCRESQNLFLTREVVGDRDEDALAAWLNAQESHLNLIVYVADQSLDDWTRLAVRQADEVLLVSDQEQPPTLGTTEAFALSIHPISKRRLVRIHPRRASTVSNTGAFLESRPVAMHHHVALGDDADIEVLCRFLRGRALGFVAGGGGAVGVAHIGIFRAFTERGFKFDILGGTSVGAALMAGFALGVTPDDMLMGVNDIFCTRASFRKPTWPKYALLDHHDFDQALRQHYRHHRIEDTWTSFFSVSTDLSQMEPRIHRQGEIWRAVRASAAIPGLLAPIFEAGHMLVDGCVIENVPVRSMRKLKDGPNVVVHFGLPKLKKYDVDYAALPRRARLLWNALFRARPIPAAPTISEVLRRTLMANSANHVLPTTQDDLIIESPVFADAGNFNWNSYLNVYREAYRWAASHLQNLEAHEPAILKYARRPARPVVEAERATDGLDVHATAAYLRPTSGRGVAAMRG